MTMKLQRSKTSFRSRRKGSFSSTETVPRAEVFDLDFALENAWVRSFKRMKRAVAASEGDQSEAGMRPEDEDAEHRDREWEIAKLQHEVRLAQNKFFSSKNAAAQRKSALAGGKSPQSALKRGSKKT